MSTKEKERDFIIPEHLKEQPPTTSSVSNSPAARYAAQAREQFAENCRLAVESALADLRRVTVNRDSTQAGRDSYDRTWQRTYEAAQRYAGIIGRNVPIPKHLPPVQKLEEFVDVGPAKFDLGQYEETRGLGKDGKGLPPVGVPGSADDWPHREAVTAGGKRK